ncbi:MAG: substrate-binding domain-containing protein [Myxococcota bacterium]
MALLFGAMADGGDSLLSAIREKRRAIGLSQVALAARAGVSRQALGAIEAGRQVPSTTLALQLAGALGCRIEDIFRLEPTGAMQASLCVGSGASSRVLLGRVGPRWVAHPIGDNDPRPADGVRHDSRFELLVEKSRLDGQILVAGCAPLLGILAERVTRSHHATAAAWIHANSRRALEMLARGEVHIAGVHLGDSSQPNLHVELARTALEGRSGALIHLTRWNQGIVTARGNPQGITADTCEPGVRWVTREPGSGARELLSHRRGLGQSWSKLETVAIASDHAEVARLVHWGVADAGIAIEAVAVAEALGFVPLVEQRFDLIVAEESLELDAVGELVDLLGRAAFRTEASQFAGYNAECAGDMIRVAS